MNLFLNFETGDFAVPITPQQALEFWFRQTSMHDDFMVMAADWRTNPELGEEDWFEELTDDEILDEDFLDDFAEARVWLVPR